MKITIDRKLLLLVSAALIACVLSGAMLGRVVATEGTYSYLKLFNEALYLVVNNYVQPVDLDTLMQGTYRGMLESLDPGNEYLSSEDYSRALRGENAGAADVGLSLSKRRGYVVVLAASPGSPASEAMLKSGDAIISIDGRSTRNMGVWQAGQALRGKPGTRAVLIVSSVEGSDRREVKLDRKVLPPPAPEAAWNPPDVGVVRITAIQAGDAKRLDQVIASLKAKGMKRLLLDLRGCVSDSLAEAVGMASLFVADGTIVTLNDRHEGDKSYKADGRRIAWDRPMTLLVDQGTARTCEVLAASLRDNLGTPIVGERTFGIGAMHALLSLRNGDGVILAVSTLVSPSGKEWNGKGIEPDLEVTGDAAESGDPQRQKAIDYLRGVSPPAGRQAA
jgi:carboxyl-terminal processing protease